MPKKKPLPEFPSPRADLMEPRHSDQEIAFIAERFRIADMTVLRHELSQALDFYECYCQSEKSKRKISEQRRMLKILDDRANGLQEVMVKLGPLEHTLLEGVVPDVVDIMWDRIIEDVETLGIAARHVLNEIDGERSKRKKGLKWEIVKLLAASWVRLTDEAATVEHNRTTEEYTGEFLEFLYLSIKPIGITMHNLSAKTVIRVLDDLRDKL